MLEWSTERLSMKSQPNWGMTSPICRIPGLLLGTRFGLFPELMRNSKNTWGGQSTSVRKMQDLQLHVGDTLDWKWWFFNVVSHETERVLPGNCMSLPKRPFSRAGKLRLRLELPVECHKLFAMTSWKYNNWPLVGNEGINLYRGILGIHSLIPY